MIYLLNRRTAWLILPLLICWIGGCATVHTEVRQNHPQPTHVEVNHNPPSLPSMAGVAYDELWIIESPKTNPSADFEPQAGSGALLTQRGPNFVFCPLVKTNIKANVIGCIATVDVSQQFQNPNREPADATYTFPLPANAAVCDFVMSIGPRHIRGVIRPRLEAEQIYKEARQQGYRASLLVEHSPHLFTQSIGSIEPEKSVDIEIRYVEPLAMEDGLFSLRIPMSLRSRAGEAAPTVRDGRNTSVWVSLNPGAPVTDIECATHPIDVQFADKGRVNVLLHPSNRISNREMVLRYQLAGQGVLPSLFTHVQGSGGYAALMVAAPFNSAKALPLDAVVAFDLSSPNSLSAARQAARQILRSMRTGDGLQILGPQGLSTLDISADEARAQLELQIDSMPASPLPDQIVQTALRSPRTNGHCQALFVIVDRDRKFSHVDQLLSQSHFDGPVAIVCIGNSQSVDPPQSHTLGPVIFLGAGANDSAMLQRIVDLLHRSALRDLKIAWAGAQVQTLSPGAPADLYAGRSQLIMVRFTGPAPTSATISGHTADGGEFHLEVPAQADPGDGAAMENIWARMSIAELLFDKREMDLNSLESQITRIAMESGLVSPFTSYVCVDATAPTPH